MAITNAKVGTGDMLKSVYDLNANDIVEKAENLLYRHIYQLTNDVLHSHDAEVSTQSLTYEKVKTITIDSLYKTPETLRIQFKLEGSTVGGNNQTAYARIYKNGVAYGVEQSTIEILKFLEDLSFATGDTIEIWAHATENPAGTLGYAYVSYFDVLGKTEIPDFETAVNLKTLGVSIAFAGTNT